jgi:hypothetical protein
VYKNNVIFIVYYDLRNLGPRSFLSKDVKRFMNLRYAVKMGELTESELKEGLGEDYPAYRKFVDSGLGSGAFSGPVKRTPK